MAPKQQDESEQDIQAFEPDFGDIYAVWDFKEHDAYKRGPLWYVIATLIIIGLCVYAYFDQNPLFIIVILLIVVTFAVSEYRGAQAHTFAITEDGFVIGDEFFSYNAIKDFYIIYEPPAVKMLYFDPKTVIRPLIGVPLEDQDPNVIRQILLNFIPENLEKEDEPTTDFLGRLLRF